MICKDHLFPILLLFSHSQTSEVGTVVVGPTSSVYHLAASQKLHIRYKLVVSASYLADYSLTHLLTVVLSNLYARQYHQAEGSDLIRGKVSRISKIVGLQQSPLLLFYPAKKFAQVAIGAMACEFGWSREQASNGSCILEFTTSTSTSTSTITTTTTKITESTMLWCLVEQSHD